MGCIFSSQDDMMPPGSYDLTPILHLPVIFVSGVPGSGKQTIAQTISSLTGYATIRPDDLEREEANKDTLRGRLIAEKQVENEEVPEQVTVDLIKEAMLANQTTRGYILVGFPKNPRMSTLFNKQVKCPEKIVALEVDNEVAAARVHDKLTELGKPSDDLSAARQIVKEAASKVKTIQKRFGGSIIMVNGSANPAELTASLKEVLSENLDLSQQQLTPQQNEQQQQLPQQLAQQLQQLAQAQPEQQPQTQPQKAEVTPTATPPPQLEPQPAVTLES